MSVTVVAAPAMPVVSTVDAKRALLVEHDADDALIDRLVAAATAEAQEQAGRSLVTQTLRLALDCWPANGIIRLWRPPVQSVTSVQYYDASGVQQTVPATDYVAVLDVSPPILIPAPGRSWPGGLRAVSPIRITYVAGYGNAAQTAAAVPDIVALILGLTAVDYENREALGAQANQQRDRLIAALQAKHGWAT